MPKDEKPQGRTLEEVLAEIDFDAAVGQEATNIKEHKLDHFEDKEAFARMVLLSEKHLGFKWIDEKEIDQAESDLAKRRALDEKKVRMWETTIMATLSASTQGNSLILKHAKEKEVDPMTLYTMYIGHIATEYGSDPEIMETLEYQVMDMFMHAERFHGRISYEFYSDLPTQFPMTDKLYVEHFDTIRESYRLDARAFIEGSKKFANGSSTKEKVSPELISINS